MTRSRGFTLPELLVTLTVLATASTLAIPAYRDWQSRIELQEASQFHRGSPRGAQSCTGHRPQCTGAGA